MLSKNKIMELVTLKVFNTEPEAQLLKAFLEANDVESFVFGNVLANTYNVFNFTSGGVQLKVSEEIFEKAKSLTEEFYKTSSEE